MIEAARARGGVLALLCLGWWVQGCIGGEPSPYYDDLGLELQTDRTAVVPLGRTMRLARTVGTVEGPLSFGSIAGLGVSEDGRLAIADRYSCEVIVVSVEALEVIGRFGGCGDGPNEFRNISSLSFQGPLLWVYDAARLRLVALDRVGTLRHDVSVARLSTFPCRPGPDWLAAPRGS